MGTLGRDKLADLVAERGEQSAIKRERKLPYVQRSVRRVELPANLDEGWYPLKELKASVRLAKNKPADELLEDEVWLLLSEMGFRYLSRDRALSVKYGSAEAERQQVDVLAVDDECAVVVECKAAQGAEVRRGSFKEAAEAIAGRRAGMINALRAAFQKPKLKVAFLFATRRYQIPAPDLERMEASNIRHLGDRDLDYYRELVAHLGEAARFQFHGDVFAGQDVPELDNRVAAIEGKMGGHTYYSFSAAPETLLKLGFVLHRSKSVRLTPSYQRLIKKNRLAQIQSFVEGGGFFPNSLLVNIETAGKKLRFDQASVQAAQGVTKLGLLHLPPRYRSLYVIDGQHRLYAYSGSQYAESNAIPVVAFVDLDRSEQLRLFMEINENQKAVSKNLKNTLDADLKWNSPNLRERAEGLKKQLALDLGDEIRSPLFGRVLVGEDERSETRIITLEALLKGINRTSFVGKYTKAAVVEHGWFDTGSSDRTLSRIRDFLFECFQWSQDRMPDEWGKKAEEGAILTTNPGITAFIWLLGDVVAHLRSAGAVNTLRDTPAQIASEMEFLLEGLVHYLNGLTFEDRILLKGKAGSGADTRIWRSFQKGVADYRPEFNPDGMVAYWKNQSKQFNLDTYDKIGDIEEFLRDEVRGVLENAFGSMWLKKGIPPSLWDELHATVARKNRDIADPSKEKEPWDGMYIVNYRDVMSFSSNWSTHFQKRFTIPGQERLKKEDKTKWLVRLNAIRNQNAHEHSVPEEDYQFVLAIHAWLIDGQDEQIKGLVAAAEPAVADQESAGSLE